ncbi:MAG: group II intron reverse transcriptase/maturase [Firmicutes bacterium]|jgi:group II intron reverse transcriptase/maturase|nr:group II intron reverse transcriptase/maturase [Bacillota bacterium]
MEKQDLKVKPFVIDKQLIMDAWHKVKSNKGSPGIDKVSIIEFQSNEKANLYKIWNRMSSGSYFPKPVRAVMIPKGNGTQRVLGVPNVEDRIAQSAAMKLIEQILEPIFCQNSYGFRPNRGAKDALLITRKRCWEKDWVIDLDIQAFFDNVDHDLMIKALKHHVSEKWILLYVERWLKTPLQLNDGTIVQRDKGTPQGAPISPILANLFMHYGFDRWMEKTHPEAKFERYADDAVIHCSSLQEAKNLKEALSKRLESIGLKLHPEKTKIVYCKDSNRSLSYECTSFDFLGYTFRSRLVNGKRGLFVSFTPAISNKAKKAIRTTIRSWHLKRRSSSELETIALAINPITRGWINYYGVFYATKIRFLANSIDRHLVLWLMQKYKRLRAKPRKAWEVLVVIRQERPTLFAHWQIL